MRLCTAPRAQHCDQLLPLDAFFPKAPRRLLGLHCPRLPLAHCWSAAAVVLPPLAHTFAVCKQCHAAQVTRTRRLPLRKRAADTPRWWQTAHGRATQRRNRHQWQMRHPDSKAVENAALREATRAAILALPEEQRTRRQIRYLAELDLPATKRWCWYHQQPHAKTAFGRTKTGLYATCKAGRLEMRAIVKRAKQLARAQQVSAQEPDDDAA